MKQTFKLIDKVRVGDYSLEYSNFNIYIRKNNILVKCIEKKKDFNNIDYTKFVERFKNLNSKR